MLLCGGRGKHNSHLGWLGVAPGIRNVLQPCHQWKWTTGFLHACTKFPYSKRNTVALQVATEQPNHTSAFRSTTLVKYEELAQTLMRHQRWDMALGRRFLQSVQCTENSLLHPFYKRVRQCYTALHTSIATSRRRIIVRRR